MSDVIQLLWPGNSPDLNPIEPTWAWLKRVTTRYGPPRTREEATRRWLQAWRDLKQSRIRRWIRRIPRHIQEIIRLKGGNEYREGRTKDDSDTDTNSD